MPINPRRGVGGHLYFTLLICEKEFIFAAGIDVIFSELKKPGSAEIFDPDVPDGFLSRMSYGLTSRYTSCRWV